MFFNLGALISLLLSMSSGPKTEVVYICWVNSETDDTCGTFGWAPTKKAASEAAIELCVNQCNSLCRVEYCEKNK